VLYWIWALTISGATTLWIWQCSVSIQKYISNPKSTLFTVVRNATMVPPSVTVCPEPPYDLAAELQLYESYNLSICGKSTNSHPSNCKTIDDVLSFIYSRNITLQEALPRLAYKTEDIIYGCNLDGRECGIKFMLSKITPACPFPCAFSFTE
jgi:hypothetical protein